MKSTRVVDNCGVQLGGRISTETEWSYSEWLTKSLFVFSFGFTFDSCFGLNFNFNNLNTFSGKIKLCISFREKNGNLFYFLHIASIITKTQNLSIYRMGVKKKYILII